MLIDLERNDLGRLCEAGSVSVDEFMAVESYAHVHHIVSNVSGRAAGRCRAGRRDPCAVSGRDDHRLPQGALHAADRRPRGRGPRRVYGRHGLPRATTASLDLNILIRTMTVHDGEIELRAGAGIVADSDPVRELDETRAKARGLLRALGSAG